MKVFLDTADMKMIKKYVQLGIIDGVTTNPTHLSKEKEKPEKIIKELVKIVPGDISVEITEKSADKVYLQAQKHRKVAPRLYL